MSEPLQGYAPIAVKVRYSIAPSPAPNGGDVVERINGHSCRRAEVRVASSDGGTHVFEVWRAEDLRGLPLRIRSLGEATPLTLNLSEVRLEAPGEELLLPPDGFTKYENAEAMLSELMVRQQNSHPRRAPAAGEFSPAGEGPAYRSTGRP